MDTASIIAKLGLDVSDFKAGLASSTQATTAAVSGINEKLESLQKGLAAGAIGEFTRKILDNADGIQKMATNLNVGTDELQAFQFAVRDAGGTTQDANRIFETARLKLDDLRAGNAVTVQSFAALGLSAKDFIGLSLDEALQKISQAYVENSDHAGAFVALQEIVGKSSRQSMTALQDLGEKGFRALITNAQEAHAVISGGTLKDLSDAKSRIEELTNVLTVGGSYILDFFLKIGSAIGIIAAEAVTMTKAIYGGGMFTKQGRDEMIAGTQAAAEEFKKLFTSAAAIEDSTKKTKDHITGQLPPLAESAALVAMRQKAEELALQASLEGADAQTKIAAIQGDIALRLQRIAASNFDANVMAKEAAGIAKDTGELKKIELAEHDQILANLLKQYDIGLKQLPIYEQGAVLQKEIALLTADIADKQAKHLDASKQIATLADTETRLAQTRQKIAADLVKASADLVSSDEQRAASAKLHIELLTGETTRMQVLQELQSLMAKDAADLTAAERDRLDVLVSQLTPEEKQHEIQTLLANGVDNLIAADTRRLAILAGQTAEIAAQQSKMAQLTAATEKFNADLHGLADMAISTFGGEMLVKAPTNLTSMSSRSLQSLVDQVNAQVGRLEAGKATADPAEAVTGYLTRSLAEAQIEQVRAAAQRELDARSAARASLAKYGEAATQYTFGDALTAQVSGTAAPVDRLSLLQQQANATLAAIKAQLASLAGDG